MFDEGKNTPIVIKVCWAAFAAGSPGCAVDQEARDAALNSRSQTG